MPRKPSKKFVQPEQLWEGYCQWRDSATNLHDRKLNDEFALHIWNIAKHLTQHHKFARYSEHIKQEMISDAYIKVVSNLKNVKEQYKNSLFSYFTNTCWCAFMDYLTKHYKNQNLKKKPRKTQRKTQRKAQRKAQSKTQRKNLKNQTTLTQSYKLKSQS